MLSDFLILVFLVLCSAFFSGSEMSYVAANKIKIEIKARKKNIAAQSAFYFISRPQDFFSTILIGNNIVTVVFASISALFLAGTFGMGEFSILVISTLVLLFFGELIPKYIAREAADNTILFIAIPLRIINFIFYPFVKTVSSVSAALTKTPKVSEEKINYLFSKEDIELLVNESREAGAVNKNESDIISRILDLGGQRVYEAMRPRTEITGIEIGSTIDEAFSAFIDSGFSKLPVYEESLDNIKGVVYAYDLFKFPQNLQSITREVSFVPETKKSFDMLNDFLNKQVSIAVVIDEFGGTAGIVTMEDIMEELFGEIRDEYDVEENICRKISTDSYIISGKVEIDFINEKYNLNIPVGDYETIAGFITSSTGRIPAQGETVVIDEYTFIIARATQIKIDLVKLTVADGEE